MELTRQCVGIDCAKKDFAACISVMDVEREVQHLTTNTFANDDQGFKAFNKWVSKYINKSIPVNFVMEATGVYHERLAHFLFDHEQKVSVVLPKRAKDFSKTLKVKKVTDKIASQYLAVMGLEKKMDLWEKPKRLFADLKALTRERNQIQKQITQNQNQLHAEQARMWPNAESIKRSKKVLELCKRQKAEIVKQIGKCIASDAEVKAKIDRIATIPGIGLLTIATIVGETNGFTNVHNKRQLISYAGYDIINQESGTSVRTKPRISKRGNRHIRKAMHMPSLSSIRSNEESKELFVRLVSKSGVKMKGVVAVHRRLLVLIYTLWKNNTTYEPNYEEKKEGSSGLPQELEQSPLYTI